MVKISPAQFTESVGKSESASYVLYKVLTVPNEAGDLKLIKVVKYNVVVYLVCLSVYSAYGAH